MKITRIALIVFLLLASFAALQAQLVNRGIEGTSGGGVNNAIEGTGDARKSKGTEGTGEGRKKGFGVITLAKGDVKIIRKFKVLPGIKAGTPLLKGDTVKTGKDSSVQISISDGNDIFVAASSRLKCKSEDSKKDKNIALELPEGSLRCKLDRLKGKTFQVKTPVAVAGVRGTDFVVNFNPALPKNAFTLSVIEGAVSVDAIDKVTQNIASSSVVRSEQKVSVTEQGKTSHVEKMTPAETRSLKQKFAIKISKVKKTPSTKKKGSAKKKAPTKKATKKIKKKKNTSQKGKAKKNQSNKGQTKDQKKTQTEKSKTKSDAAQNSKAETKSSSANKANAKSSIEPNQAAAKKSLDVKVEGPSDSNLSKGETQGDLSSDYIDQKFAAVEEELDIKVEDLGPQSNEVFDNQIENISQDSEEEVIQNFIQETIRKTELIRVRLRFDLED